MEGLWIVARYIVIIVPKLVMQVILFLAHVQTVKTAVLFEIHSRTSCGKCQKKRPRNPLSCFYLCSAIRKLVVTTKTPIWKTDLAFAGDMIQIGPEVTFVYPQLTDYYAHGHHQDEFLPQFEQVWRKRHPQMQFSSKGIAGQYLVDWEH